jgi:hypothetical protein
MNDLGVALVFSSLIDEGLTREFHGVQDAFPPSINNCIVANVNYCLDTVLVHAG